MNTLNINFEKLKKKAILFYNSDRADYEFYLYHIRDMGIENSLQDYQEEMQFTLQNEKGLAQEPKQFASLLSFLANQECKTYCEIGINAGFSFLLMVSVLARKNKNIKAVTIDPYQSPDDRILNLVKDFGVELTHREDTSDCVSGQEFDIVHIDGDHSYKWVKHDWEHVGKHAGICIFHDIVPNLFNQGPPLVFQSIRGLKVYIETSNNIMGFGIAFPRASRITN